LWTPETPFLYQAIVELWQSGQRCEVVHFRHGLRTIQLGPRGLVLNGRPLVLRGITLKICSEPKARTLHQQMYNLLLVRPTPQTVAIWDIGDRFGFFLIGHIMDKEQFLLASNLRQHPCTLGWLVGGDALKDELLAAVLPNYWAGNGKVVGVEITQPDGERP